MTQTSFFENLTKSMSPDLVADLAQALLDVEEFLGGQMKSRVPLVQGAGQLTLRAGGKRLRPALAVISAMATGSGFSPARAVPIGASLEMVHMATLIHDDVIDEAATRRGEPTAAAVYGNTGSILSGDVLLAKAMKILALDGDLAIIRSVAESVVEMAEGEAREVESRGCFELNVEEHLAILRMKTAAFIECCCRAGALLAEAPPSIEDRLGQFGHHLGMAFQIQDDVLDYQGDKRKTGKPWATDFREGCATLPLIYLLPQLTEAERAFTRVRFGTDISHEDLMLLTGWMKERGILGKADSVARQEVGLAKAALDGLPSSEAKEILLNVADFVIDREA